MQNIVEGLTFPLSNALLTESNDFVQKPNLWFTMSDLSHLRLALISLPLIEVSGSDDYKSVKTTNRPRIAVV